MNLKIFNTLSKKVEPFKPLSDIVKVYACGPTVYNYPHIGNARPAIIGDILIRILRNILILKYVDKIHAHRKGMS